MIKFSATQSNGRKLLVFGLSFENIRRMTHQSLPIQFQLDEISSFEADVTIFAGATEAQMVEELRAAGFTWQEPT